MRTFPHLIDGVASDDFGVIWDFLVSGRAPSIETVPDYDNLLTVADFLCVRGFRDLRAEPQFYDGACVLT